MTFKPPTVNYYAELGLGPYAVSTDIRAAYKRLALIWHPDRNKAKGAESKFKNIKQAYDILIDENQRRKYDDEQALLSQQQAAWFEPARPKNYTQPHAGRSDAHSHSVNASSLASFNLQAFDNLMSTPIDPFDVLGDIGSFQEPDFMFKLINSSSYRHLFTDIFNSMNSTSVPLRSSQWSAPIYVDNMRCFQTSKKPHARSRRCFKRYSTGDTPVIHSTMAHDWFLNQLLDLHERKASRPLHA